MHSILFSLQKPKDDEREKLSNWHNSVKTVESAIGRNGAVEPLGQGAWLLTGKDAMPVLHSMLTVVQNWQLPYRILFVKDATEWTDQTNDPAKPV